MTRLWLVQMALIEFALATGIMLIGMEPLGVFTAVMAAHSAYLSGRPR